ncbi:hypothetical protein NHH03_20905 [Stieleria sp. TO1_6]|uniref:cytochrome c3 family protein n=1 Tax=Stieleria tagensis TaxID=2956795 RepID=UPI00209B1B67|nr:cytochrome c3 family protein [Stieleria tagensis]MCO8124215.1 hypothetical protein [Stieleria tagensis]
MLDLFRHPFFSLTCHVVWVLLLAGCSRQEPSAADPQSGVSAANDSSNADAATGPAGEHDSVVTTAESLPGGFVGTATCAECHPARFDSYKQTHHSRSLHLPSADDGPTGLAFHHLPSHRSYQVKRVGQEVVHCEDRYFGDSPQTADTFRIAERPVEYVMGSGAFAKAYLVRDGDYLLQSPVTWYTAKDGYAIAPGYDNPRQRGFNRVIDDRCLYCHAGILSLENENPNTPTIHELAIGCERCHGQGAEHTAIYRQASQQGADAEVGDSKIVNPSKLDRRRSESICAQCHLDSDVVVQAEGQTVWDFHPGEELVHNSLAYKAIGTGQPQKTFSNHFDQMWQSECYLQSETLSCVSCHDPHASQPPADQLTAFRKVCLDCHADQGCSQPIHQRQQTNGDACTACHMPRSPSEVPHASVTNHRIAIYLDDPSVEPLDESDVDDDAAMRRVALQPIPLTDQDLQRRDAIAAASWSILRSIEGDPEPVRQFDESRLVDLVNDKDAELLGLLADVYRRRADANSVGNPNAVDPVQLKRERDLSHFYAVKALRVETGPSKIRQAALETLADKMMIDQSFDQAVPLYEELTGIRRDARDWYNLALCYFPLRQMGKTEAALRAAIELDPSYVKPYASLARLYQSVDPQLAAQFQQLAQRLSQ